MPPGDTGTVRELRADARLERIRIRVVAAAVRMSETLPFAILVNLGRANITDRAMTLAGQAFTSILPVMILITSLSTNGPIDRAMTRIGTQWLQLEPASPIGSTPGAASFGVVGAFMTIVGATSFSRALDRMYAEVWGTPKLGVAGWWRWPLVIAAFVLGITAEVFGIRGSGIGQSMVAATLVSCVLWALVWAYVTRLLTAGRVRRDDVLLTGAAAGVVVAVFFLSTELAFGPILHGAEVRFGTLGVVFSVISWLFVYAWLVVAAVVVARTVRTRSTPGAHHPGTDHPSAHDPDAEAPVQVTAGSGTASP